MARLTRKRANWVCQIHSRDGKLLYHGVIHNHYANWAMTCTQTKARKLEAMGKDVRSTSIRCQSFPELKKRGTEWPTL